jgi:hypothetical protein
MVVSRGGSSGGVLFAKLTLLPKFVSEQADWVQWIWRYLPMLLPPHSLPPRGALPRDRSHPPVCRPR